MLDAIGTRPISVDLFQKSTSGMQLVDVSTIEWDLWPCWAAKHRRDGGNMEDQDIGMVLDVTPGDHEGFERHLLEGMGHRVEVCHGPEGHNCPLLEEGSCELIEEAHGVVFKLDLDREYHRHILARYRLTLPDDAPIAVAVEPGQEREYHELLDGLYVWNHQPTTADLDGFAALVEAADRTR